MAKRRIEAALALIEQRGRYLICKRRADDVLGGYWEFPGGKRKPHESWRACLKREVREELGVTVKMVAPFTSLRHEDRRCARHFTVYRCVLARGTPRPLTAQALRWVPARQLGRYRFPPANRPLITTLRDML